jgi:hypothetical protein
MIAFIQITEQNTQKKVMINVNQINFIQEGWHDEALIGLENTSFVPVEKYTEIHERIKNLLAPKVYENHIS